MVTSLQSWTKALGTVLQYSYFSVISRFPVKTVHTFQNCSSPSPHPIQSWNSEKILDTRVQHCLWGVGRGWTCVNWKTPQKRESVPRLLSMIVGQNSKHIADAVISSWGDHGLQWKNAISWNQFSTISMQWRDTKKLKLKKIREKKEEEEKKIPYSFTPTCLLILYCYNGAGVYGLDSSDGFLLYVQTRSRRNTRLKIQIVHSQGLMNM